MTPDEIIEWFKELSLTNSDFDIAIKYLEHYKSILPDSMEIIKSGVMAVNHCENILKKELETYKKALDMACEDIKYEICTACRLIGDCDECKYSYDYVEEYLQKARTEND